MPNPTYFLHGIEVIDQSSPNIAAALIAVLTPPSVRPILAGDRLDAAAADPGAYETNRGTIDSVTLVYLLDGLVTPGATLVSEGQSIAVRAIVAQSAGPSSVIDSDTVLVLPEFDVVPPVLLSLSPQPGTQDVPPDVTLLAQFNEVIDFGAGLVTFRNAGDVIETVSAAELLIAGSAFEVPHADFPHGAELEIAWPAGIAKDEAGNPVASLAPGAWTLNVAAAPDVTAPQRQALSPEPASRTAATSDPWTAIYGEPMQAGTGDVTYTVGGVAYTVPVADLTYDGNSISIPKNDIAAGDAIEITAPEGWATDAAGNPAAAILAGEWTFTLAEILVFIDGFPNATATLGADNGDGTTTTTLSDAGALSGDYLSDNAARDAGLPDIAQPATFAFDAGTGTFGTYTANSDTVVFDTSSDPVTVTIEWRVDGVLKQAGQTWAPSEDLTDRLIEMVVIAIDADGNEDTATVTVQEATVVVVNQIQRVAGGSVDYLTPPLVSYSAANSNSLENLSRVFIGCWFRNAGNFQYLFSGFDGGSIDLSVQTDGAGAVSFIVSYFDASSVLKETFSRKTAQQAAAGQQFAVFAEATAGGELKIYSSLDGGALVAGGTVGLSDAARLTLIPGGNNPNIFARSTGSNEFTGVSAKFGIWSPASALDFGDPAVAADLYQPDGLPQSEARLNALLGQPLIGIDRDAADTNAGLHSGVVGNNAVTGAFEDVI